MGIWVSYYLRPEIIYTKLVLFAGIFLLGLGLLASRKIPSPLYLTFTVIAFFAFGSYRLALTLPDNQPDHYLHQLDNREHLYDFKLVESLNPTRSKIRWKAKVIAVDGIQKSGLVLIDIPDSLNAQFWAVGDRILAWNTLYKPRSGLNPHNFDYASYLATDAIFALFYLKPDNFRHIPEQNPSWLEGISRLRNTLIVELKKSNLTEEQSGLAQALLLGYRGLSPEQYTNYQRAGAAHILAVSGLHVGIFCAIIGWLFWPIRLLKFGRILHGLFVIVLLWSYVFLAGGGAAIFRAAVLFTLLTYAMLTEKSGQSMHFWALAVLFLLGLVNPLWLFRPGFLLSFAAVWSILMFYPKLYKIWPFKKGGFAYIGQLNCLGLAAQIGVLPISLYYFHQFPLHFLLANLLMVPYLGIVLGWGYLELIGLYFKIAPNWLTVSYGWLLNCLNYLTTRLGNLDDLIISNISWGIPELLISLLGILVLAYRIRLGRLQTLSIALGLLALLEGYWIFESFKSAQIQALIIPHQNDKISIWMRNGRELTVFTRNSVRPQSGIDAYITGERINKILFRPLQNAYMLNNERLLIIDSVGIYPKTGYRPAFVILTGSPKVHLGRVIETLKPQLIIADGTNYNWSINRWKQTCHEYSIPFYATSEVGAYVKYIRAFP